MIRKKESMIGREIIKMSATDRKVYSTEKCLLIVNNLDSMNTSS